LKAIVIAFNRDPAPFVTRCRRRTVANGDSTTLLVRRCFQCSAGKSKKVSSFSQSRRSDSIGDVPYSVDLRVIEAAVSRVDGSYAAFC
jgi:hypothetical protein